MPQPNQSKSEPQPAVSDTLSWCTQKLYKDCQPVTGRITTNLPGRSPATSRRGSKYLLVLYDFDSNAILTKPMRRRTGPEHLTAYQFATKTLVDRGLRPWLQRLDNEASEALKEHITSNDVDFHLPPSHIHRRNATERAIQTFKNHLIAMLSSCDQQFTMNLWDQLIAQAQITLKILCPPRLNPRLFVYAQLEGAFNFD